MVENYTQVSLHLFPFFKCTFLTYNIQVRFVVSRKYLNLFEISTSLFFYYEERAIKFGIRSNNFFYRYKSMLKLFHNNKS